VGNKEGEEGEEWDDIVFLSCEDEEALGPARFQGKEV
jgi:hypothetical protein